MSSVLLQNERLLFQQASDTSAPIFSTGTGDTVTNHSKSRTRERAQRPGNKPAAEVEGAWVGFECRNISGGLLETLAINVTGRRVLAARTDTGPAPNISGEVLAQNSSAVQFRKQLGVTRATMTYKGELTIGPTQRVLAGNWRGRGIQGSFALWSPRRFQAISDAVRLLVTLGHGLGEVADQSGVLGPTSSDAINRLVADRKERGERLPELEEIIRDIS